MDWKENALIGCYFVIVSFSTFDYLPSGVLEDFFIYSKYWHQGITRHLGGFAYRESGVFASAVENQILGVSEYSNVLKEEKKWDKEEKNGIMVEL